MRRHLADSAASCQRCRVSRSGTGTRSLYLAPTGLPSELSAAKLSARIARTHGIAGCHASLSRSRCLIAPSSVLTMKERSPLPM